MLVKGIACGACLLRMCESNTTCAYCRAAWSRASLPALEGFVMHAKLSPALCTVERRSLVEQRRPPFLKLPEGGRHAACRLDIGGDCELGLV
jgi:hypothetical protein